MGWHTSVIKFESVILGVHVEREKKNGLSLVRTRASKFERRALKNSENKETVYYNIQNHKLREKLVIS